MHHEYSACFARLHIEKTVHVGLEMSFVRAYFFMGLNFFYASSKPAEAKQELLVL